jgi:hypothetical protein
MFLGVLTFPLLLFTIKLDLKRLAEKENNRIGEIDHDV